MKNDIDTLLKAEEEKEQGNALFKKGEYELSIFHYTRSINYSPESSILYTNRSLAYFKIGRYDKSLEDALKARKLDEDNLKSYYRICEAYNALNDVDNYKKYLHMYNEKRIMKGMNAKRIDTNAEAKAHAQDNMQQTHNSKKHYRMYVEQSNLPDITSAKKEVDTNSNKTKEKDIKVSKELMDLCSKNEKEKFLFFNNNNEIKEKEKNILFEKEKYKNNFLIEEVYDFKEKEQNYNVLNNQMKNNKKDMTQDKFRVHYNDICNDIKLFFIHFKDLFMSNSFYLPVFIQKELKKTKINFTNSSMSFLKYRADTLFSEKKFYSAVELYNEIARRCESEKNVYYCTVLSNRSACFIEMKKVVSALCDISRSLYLLYDFFEKHKENINNIKKELSSFEEGEIEALFCSTDIDAYKDSKNIYLQAHKLLIKLLYRYIKFVHLHRKRFRLPSLSQVSIKVRRNRASFGCVYSHTNMHELEHA
ncbi:tetratricopeptide repeat protein [Plasmodium brasilianum]|nr:tetratricopeptide repeat protein [Plasmodium brasilianum]